MQQEEDLMKAKLGIAPIAWSNDDLPEFLYGIGAWWSDNLVIFTHDADLPFSSQNLQDLRQV